MMTIHPTVRTTRKGNLSWVFDERDQPIYSAEDLRAILDWLCEEGHTEAKIEGYLTEWELALTSTRKEDIPG